MRGDVTKAIIEQLRIHKLMTMADLCQELGLGKDKIWHVLRCMQKPTTRPAMPKRVYIAEWVYEQEGQRRYPRPLYGLGPYPDAKRPEPDKKANKQRYVQLRRKRLTTNSVFNLAGAMKRGQFQINL